MNCAWADNLNGFPSAGPSVGSDTVGGVEYQRVKPVTGADGTVTDVSPTNPMPVAGKLVTASATFARPADTTAYAALDAVSDSTSAPTVLQFTGVVRANGGNGYVMAARLLTDQKTNVARYRLHLYHTTPAAINDNSPYLLLWADRAKRVGVIDFAAAATEDATNSTAAYSTNTGLRIPFVCASADTKIYGLIETLDAFTPANAQNFYIELDVEQN